MDGYSCGVFFCVCGSGGGGVTSKLHRTRSKRSKYLRRWKCLIEQEKAVCCECGDPIIYEFGCTENKIWCGECYDRLILKLSKDICVRPYGIKK